MEDDESGGSSLNSSDGGSGSWSPSPSLNKNATQQVPSREGLHFLPLKSWSSGGYGRMESQQLLSNDFYTRQFSRARPEQSDEDFDEETDEEGVEQQQGHNAGEDGSESDYDGVYEETQLLQQYNAAHYSKVDHEEKLRCRGTFNLPVAGDNNRHRLGETTPAFAETQLLENYDLNCYGSAQQKMGKPIHIPRGDHAKDPESLQHEKINADAETADEAEPTEVLDSDGGTDDDATTTSRHDQKEVVLKGKPRSEFRQERIFEFDVDLNVSLEEDMDCGYYGEPMIQDTQLIPVPETQVVGQYQGDTQLISTSEKDIPNSHVGTDAKEIPADVDLNRSRDIPMALGGTKAASSSLLELPSLTTESRLSAIPSASEASEGSPFQICVGTVHAESIRIAAMQPITWHPKLKLDDHSSRILPLKSVYRPELPSSEPEWMRDYGSNQEERRGASGLGGFNIPKDSKALGHTEPAELGAITPQTSISGLKSPFETSYTPGSPYNGTTTRTLGSESRFSQMKTALPPRSSLGPRLPSPTSSANYLDSAEPGEEVQAQALDMVDKLVWLNTDAAPASPPRRYKKSFSGLPPATPTITNPALQVFEFEDTPVKKSPGSDLSLIKEIQAGWKKKAEQNYLFPATRKGKEKGTPLLPEGERLSKLLTEDDFNKVCEPKRLSTNNGEAGLDKVTRKSSPVVATQEVTTTDGKGDQVANEKKRVRGNLAEPAEVADDDLLNVVGIGLRKRSSSRAVQPEELEERKRVQEERQVKVPDGTLILTRRRSQGTRNRREHIRIPASRKRRKRPEAPVTQPTSKDAVLQSGNHSSPEGTTRMDIETEKNPSNSRKRRSLNIMLRERGGKRTRPAVEEAHEDHNEAHGDHNEAHEDHNEAHEDHNEDHEDHNEAHEDENDAHEDQSGAHEDDNEAHEDQNEVHDDMDILSSPASSGADPMFTVPNRTLNKRRKANIDNTDKDEGKAVVEAEKNGGKGKKRMRLTEAAKLLEASFVGDMRSEDGRKTRSLRQLRRSDNNRPELESTIPPVVQKRLRSVRRGSGGLLQGAPKASVVDDVCDVEQDASTSTWSATFQGDSDNEGVEVNDDVSSPEQSENENEEISDQGGVPVEDRSRMKRTRSIADVSSPSTPALHFPLVTGRRGRGASVKPEMMEEPTFLVPPAGKGLRLRTVRRRRDPQMLAVPSENALEFNLERSASVSTEGSLRSRRGTHTVSVLFSHGLSEDTVKKQRKIVEKLDGKTTRKAADCTHFVAEKFVRTGNMLEAMAAGKYVVTFAWLENCQLANCFIEERNFLLQDEKKERELGFSMRSTILAAQQKPLLQGIRVLLTPNISPKPQAIAAIVQAAGGQVVEEYEGPSSDAQNEDLCLVIANDDDLEICVSFLDQGAKVYRSELILSGITSHHLDFSKHELFENYRGGRRRGLTSKQT